MSSTIACHTNISTHPNHRIYISWDLIVVRQLLLSHHESTLNKNPPTYEIDSIVVCNVQHKYWQ